VRGGWAKAPATLVDADIATISGATDKVIRVGGPPDWLLAIDFQSGHDSVAKLPDFLLYNSALFRRHRLLVRSLLVLLRPEADSPRLTGLYERGFAYEPFDVALRYRILRVWQVPPEQWLSGGLGVVPLAPLGLVREEELPAVVDQVKERLKVAASPRRTAELWVATYILMGLRYGEEQTNSLLQGVFSMKESVTYQAILREGKAEGIVEGEAKGEAKGEAREARKMLLLVGRKKFGNPSPEVQASLDALVDVKRLEELTVRVIDAAGWQDLLGLSAPRQHSNRRKRSS
jgi:hypothetical protein